LAFKDQDIGHQPPAEHEEEFDADVCEREQRFSEMPDQDEQDA
jgi:hypothetical protein